MKGNGARSEAVGLLMAQLVANLIFFEAGDELAGVLTQYPLGRFAWCRPFC